MGITNVLRLAAPPADFPIGQDLALLIDAANIARASIASDSAVQSEVSSLYTGRQDLVYGTYYPDTTTAGYYGMPSITNTISTNTTYSTAGQTISNTHFDGCRVSVTAANVSFVNCLFTGDNTVNAMVSCTNVNVVNAQFTDCTWLPKFLVYGSGGFTQIGIGGHDFELYRCDISRVVDAINVQNGTLFGTFGPGWSCGVKVYGCYLHAQLRWTAATGGIVHPSDEVTHNDLLQISGGIGLEMVGNTLDANLELQYGHMYLKSAGGTVYTRPQAYALPDTGPWIIVANGTLGDGGPFGPEPPFTSNGTGLKSRGELSSTDQAGLMINSSQGYTANIMFTDNLCMGGEFFTNGGGNVYPGGGQFLGSFLRNCFTRDQGNQGTGVGNGHTIDLGGTWGGHYTAPTVGVDRNFYIDVVSGSDTITVRT